MLLLILRPLPYMEMFSYIPAGMGSDQINKLSRTILKPVIGEKRYVTLFPPR